MKPILLLIFSALFTISASAQLLRVDDAVEVDILLGDTVKHKMPE